MTEAEIKAILSPEQAGQIDSRLSGLGFRELGEQGESDLYFNGLDRDFRVTDEALRIRSTVSGGESRSCITYKGPKLDTRSKTRIEHETDIGDPKTGEELLRALGFRPVLRITKTRRMLERDGITACIDEVRGLGSFLELECVLENQEDSGQAVDKLYACLAELGLPTESLTTKSYLELLMDKPDKK